MEGIAQETLDALLEAGLAAGMDVSAEMLNSLTPEQVENYARMASLQVKRIGVGAKKKQRGDSEEAKWLAYSDAMRDGRGFVAWEAFEHPELGEVEIGGWSPYFRVNPPAEETSAIAEKELAFVLDLAERLPNVRLADVKVTVLAEGLYEVKAAVVNDGYLPTGTAMAKRNRRARPHVVRLSVPNEQVVSGQRIHKLWSIPGSGGREDLRWIIEAEPNSLLTITVYSEKYGTFDDTVQLNERGRIW